MQLFHGAKQSPLLPQGGRPVQDGRLWSLDPHRRYRRAGATHIGHAGPGRDGARQMRQSGYLVRAGSGLAHGQNGGRINLAEQQHGAHLIGRRQYLDRNLRQRRQSAETAGHQLAQIVAGDVLDHPAAGLECLAPARNSFEAQEMIPRRARLDTPRPGQIGGEDTANGRFPQVLIQIAEIRRFERQLLPLLRQHRLYLTQGRSRAGAQHKLFGLVQIDAIQGGKVQAVVRGHGPAQARLAAAADQFDGLFLRSGPGQHLGHLRGVPWFQSFGHQKPIRNEAARGTAVALCARSSGQARRNCAEQERPCPD